MMRRIRRNGLPKYCSWNVDREGKRFVRFRRGGLDLYLRGALFSEAWWRQYASAMDGVEPEHIPSPARVLSGSMNDLAQAYYRSATFHDLKPSTQTMRRNIIGAFCKLHGDKPVKLLTRRHVADIIGAKADTPMAANNLLKVLRYLLDLAVERDMIAANPASAVKLYRSKSEGHHTWAETEHQSFVARHAFGTKAHLAEALLLYTMQRKGDVVRMGRQHIVMQRDEDGIERPHLKVRQEKTGEPLLIPIHPKLWQVIEALPKKNLTFLTTERGAPFSSAGFGNWFRARCDEAGLPHCSAHGLRKLATVRLLEAGATHEMVKSMGGWRSDSSLRPYKRKVNQAKLAQQAMATLIGAEREQELSSDAIPPDKTASK
jgi:integrase